MSKNIYKLYALKISKGNIAQAEKTRFHRITADYVLIYTAEEQPKNSVEISEAETNRLTSRDKGWLFDCNYIIINEETAKHKDDIINGLDEKMAQLEDALVKEREKLNGGTNQSDE